MPNCRYIFQSQLIVERGNAVSCSVFDLRMRDTPTFLSLCLSTLLSDSHPLLKQHALIHSAKAFDVFVPPPGLLRGACLESAHPGLIAGFLTASTRHFLIDPTRSASLFAAVVNVAIELDPSVAVVGTFLGQLTIISDVTFLTAAFRAMSLICATTSSILPTDQVLAQEPSRSACTHFFGSLLDRNVFLLTIASVS
jgi:hypothetical protein